MKITAYRSRDSYAQVNWEMVKEVGGDITLAVVFDWITWKADPAYDGVEDSDAVVWYSATVSALAATMNVTDKVVRRALDELVKRGHLAVAELRLTGPYDRTKSYRPLWEEEANPAPETSAPPAPNDDETPALEGDSTCPVGQLPFALQGNSELPYRANAPLSETSTELTNKRLTLIDDEDLPQVDTEKLFSLFWDVWPRRVERKAAVAAFEKALRIQTKREDPRSIATAALTIIGATKIWTTHWKTVEQRAPDKIPHAATWLNGERWTDELPVQSIDQPTRKLTNVEQNLANYHAKYGDPDGTAAHRGALDSGLRAGQQDRQRPDDRHLAGPDR